MLYDVRKNTLKVSKTKTFIYLYRKKGYGIQCKYLGKPVIFLTSESGELNQILIIWQFKNAADREEKHQALWADQNWLDYVDERNKLDAIETQQNNLMNNIEFLD